MLSSSPGMALFMHCAEPLRLVSGVCFWLGWGRSLACLSFYEFFLPWRSVVLALGRLIWAAARLV